MTTLTNSPKLKRLQHKSNHIWLASFKLPNYASQIQQSAKSFLILRYSLTQRSICFNFYSRRDSFQFFSYALVMISWKKLQNMQFDWKSSWHNVCPTFESCWSKPFFAFGCKLLNCLHLLQQGAMFFYTLCSKISQYLLLR